MQIRTKIWQNNVKSPTAPRFSTIARPPNGPKSIHNASIASNKVLNTSQSTQDVNKLISEGFRYKLEPKFTNFCIFSNCVRSKFSFYQIPGKRKGLELRDVISANINMAILNSLSPNLTLYDLQMPRYLYGVITATPKKGVAILGFFGAPKKLMPGLKIFIII